MRIRILSLLVAAVHAPLAADPGTLVIVGGGLSAANAPVYRAFLDARPVANPRIAIIPSASGAPSSAAGALAEALVRHGARPADIAVVHLANQDDPSTPDVDERTWAANAADGRELAKLAGAGAIWLTGGDQLRTTSLLAPGGRETPVLAAIRARLADGAVVGGTSAGAAVMSGPMITDGDPLESLLRPVSRQSAIEDGAPDNRLAGGGLVLGRGLGFLPQGLVDQHFDVRHRLGRLARALFELPPDQRFGFGIDEDTALVIDLASGEARVTGRASVTVLDARAARRAKGARFGASGLRLAIAGPGDRIAPGTLAVSPAPGARARTPDPDEDQPCVQQASGGMAVPEPPMGALLSACLFGARPAAALDRPSLRGSRGVRYRFTARPGASSWETGSNHSVTGIGLSIEPFSIPLQGQSR